MNHQRGDDSMSTTHAPTRPTWPSLSPLQVMPAAATVPRRRTPPLRALARFAGLHRRAGQPAGQRASDRRPAWIDALECEANAMTVAPGAAAPDRRTR
jgi:hypothetical protein